MYVSFLLPLSLKVSEYFFHHWQSTTKNTTHAAQVYKNRQTHVNVTYVKRIWEEKFPYQWVWRSYAQWRCWTASSPGESLLWRHTVWKTTRRRGMAEQKGTRSARRGRWREVTAESAKGSIITGCMSLSSFQRRVSQHITMKCCTAFIFTVSISGSWWSHKHKIYHMKQRNKRIETSPILGQSAWHRSCRWARRWAACSTTSSESSGWRWRPTEGPTAASAAGAQTSRDRCPAGPQQINHTHMWPKKTNTKLRRKNNPNFSLIIQLHKKKLFNRFEQVYILPTRT